EADEGRWVVVEEALEGLVEGLHGRARAAGRTARSCTSTRAGEELRGAVRSWRRSPGPSRAAGAGGAAARSVALGGAGAGEVGGGQARALEQSALAALPAVRGAGTAADLVRVDALVVGEGARAVPLAANALGAVLRVAGGARAAVDGAAPGLGAGRERL